VFAITSLAVLASYAVMGSSPQQVTVTYLANEGIMIDCGGQKVLIDALFRDSLEHYVRHSPKEKERIETGKAPFDGVRLALATHYHLDHWDAGAISRFLTNNPEAVFASTPEATAMLPYEFHGRVRALRPRPGYSARFGIGAAQVQAFRLGHDNTPNIGYRITICGKTLVHLGDADGPPASFATVSQQGSVDVAMVPFWWFLDSKATEFLLQRWRPKHTMAFHLATTDGVYADQLRQKFRQVWVCTRQGEAHAF
jgi:L-ascorbate metabolism protein UlaG (beta-lactamase superfamily)